jgi:hypothetical protein
MVTVGLVVRLAAKPGRELELEQFLRSALPLVENEPGTTAWFAVKFGPFSFGIFDAFPHETARQAHLAGGVAAALSTGAELQLPRTRICGRSRLLLHAPDLPSS